MTPLQYLESLIAGQQCSSIGVQTCELKFLRTLMLTQGQSPEIPADVAAARIPEEPTRLVTPFTA